MGLHAVNQHEKMETMAPDQEITPAQREVFRAVADAIAACPTDRFQPDIAAAVIKHLDEIYAERAHLRGVPWPLLTPKENYT